MSTCSQIIRKKRFKPKPKVNRYLAGAPQVSGVVLSVLTRKPKKPNSANRSLIKVRLSSGLITYAYVPGEKHNLQPHSKVLIRGGRRKDMIGVNLIVIRGAKRYDCQGVVGRGTGRSRYGCAAS